MAKVIYAKTLDALNNAFDWAHTVVVCDQKAFKNNSAIRKFLKNFKHVHVFASGEKLKSFENFHINSKKIVNHCQDIPSKQLKLLAIGGGSITDFVGFLSSVYHRGVGFEIIPSTWLAAIDSAHGGKNALNGYGAKNQFGTFYNPSKVCVISEILESQPNNLRFDAMSEMIKMAIIDGGPWAKKLLQLKNITPHEMLKLLPFAVKAKYKVIKADPYEQKGIRQILNLGHTTGHVFEAYAGVTHGTAIALGLRFSIKYSLESGYIKLQDAEKFLMAIDKLCSPMPLDLMVPEKSFLKMILKDKKKASLDEIYFVFPRGLGSVLRKKVKVSQLLSEAKRQKVVK